MHKALACPAFPWFITTFIQLSKNYANVGTTQRCGTWTGLAAEGELDWLSG